MDNYITMREAAKAYADRTKQEHGKVTRPTHLRSVLAKKLLESVRAHCHHNHKDPPWSGGEYNLWEKAVIAQEFVLSLTESEP